VLQDFGVAQPAFEIDDSLAGGNRRCGGRI